MKQVYIINENHPQLLLFFAGWAADETPFKQYRPKNMDYMICYDYRTLDFDYSIFDHYRQVNVVAWSMGVWMGSLILSQVSRDKVFSLAFNGTTYPIDNLEGIPVKTFQATLDGLTPATLQKFLRRMCKDSNAYKAFMEVTPRRDFDEIKEELRLILERYFDLFGDANNKSYDEEKEDKYEANIEKYNYEYNYAFIGKNDRIFPPENMEMNFCDLIDCHPVLTDNAHYDESMFRFLLQDMWEMTASEFRYHVKTINIE